VGDPDARLQSGVGMDSHLRVRWDRVFALLAALTVVLILIGHAIFRGADTGHADSTSAEPHQAAAPATKPCPPPTSKVLRTAPGEGEQRTVALTFDDGPGPWTDEVLEILARENVKATFFVVGRLAVAERDRVKRAYAAGHAVENHSWSHPWPNQRTGWNRRSIRAQIRRTNAAISSVTGQQPCYFRPPQGVVKGAEQETRSAGLSIALWSVDTRDWATRGPSAAARIRTRAQLGLEQHHPVILMHDGGGNRAATVAALPGVIDDYRRHGYQFVTLQDGRT
jgi:peptidoglycan/xylan/chitin deacetylase (PgdA/CDA1 family)